MVKNLLRSEKAVSAVVGVMIILALTITSISVILLYSAPSMENMQDMASAQRAEQAFTVFDSRTSKVALGESPSQTTSFSIMDGSVSVNGDEQAYQNSQIVVVCTQLDSTSWHTNYRNNRYKWNSWEGYESEDNVTVFNSSLGSITYIQGERLIGYEGGGVWSKYPTGKAVMISPPEFHYNGETLTLPIMKIYGNEVFSGKTDVAVTVSSDNMPVVLYPDNIDRVNPLNSDKVLIYIKSEFYTAWAEYADSLTYASAETDDANQTAVVELEVLPEMGKDQLKQAFKIGSLNNTNPTPLYDFALNLEAKSSQGLNPNNYQIAATSGTKTLTYYIQKTGNDKLTIELAYEDTATNGGIENWEGANKNEDAFPINDSKEDSSATVDLLSESINMIYTSNEADFSWGPESSVSIPPDLYITKSQNQTQLLYNISQHYMKLLTMDGSVKFNIQSPGQSDPVDYSESTLNLFYDGMPGSITYLHVSRNDLSVALS
ncbi:DUF7289 family protein [Methanolobus halotolerans]|uniref:DUF7308 domain-containing protein n=1 Tax=Methanolobus halotolerans TaxID=2052935 RepID=A0A4E0Q2T1_9EURY|nr:hypothetical protein [Methanolobus halotolerans]TGC07300.1 hypothetical protein CUN85_11645 [Methanolobus halotolerans]